MAKKKAGPKVSLAGVQTDAIPESPVFRDAARPREARRVLHVNGIPVPEELAHAIPYENTDEGVAERLDRPHAMAQVTRGPFEKTLDARAAAQLGIDDAEPPDPLRDAADRYLGPGQRPRFLSQPVIARRGLRGFEVVKDERGEPVKVGSMVLGWMPEEKAAARNRQCQAKGQELLLRAQEEHEEQVARDASEAGFRLPQARRGGGDRAGGLQEVRGNSQEILR